MKTAWILSLAAAIGVAGVAQAATWEANNLLLPAKSSGGCADHYDRYQFELVGTTFTRHNVNGPLFVTTVAPDGAVDIHFKSPGGANLEIFRERQDARPGNIRFENYLPLQARPEA